jgi:hypothetical protein
MYLRIRKKERSCWNEEMYLDEAKKTWALVEEEEEKRAKEIAAAKRKKEEEEKKKEKQDVIGVDANSESTDEDEVVEVVVDQSNIRHHTDQ